jgi:xyloglucan-specific exo-beta-1,4-glucanase
LRSYKAYNEGIRSTMDTLNSEEENRLHNYYSMKMKYTGRVEKRSIVQKVYAMVWCLLITSTFLTNSVWAQTESYTWNNVAIGGGGFVSGIIASKTKQGLIYARTDVGGAYRWDADNSKWIPLLDWTSEDQVGYQGVESLATDPVEPNKVYMLVGTSYFNNGKTAILRSSDYGNTFSITDVTSQFKAHGNGMGRQTGEKLVVDPNSNNILLCGTRYNGLFKSTDSGVTWTRLSGLNITTTPTPTSTNSASDANGISFVVLDPSTGSSGSATQTIIAGVSRTGDNNLYRSDDGGATFSAITSAPTSLMPHRAVLASDRNLYITYATGLGPWDVQGSGQIWKYNLQSGTWTNITPSFSGSFGGISVDPANPNRLVASTVNIYYTQDKTYGSYGDRMFLSTDGGTTWTDVVDRGFSVDPQGVTWINGQSIHWAGSIEFDPFDTQKVWVISGNGVFQTDNIDATAGVWKFQVKELEETVLLDIVSIPNGPMVSVIGDYDGFRHTDVTQYAPRHTPSVGTTTGIAYASLNPNIMLRAGAKTVNSVQVGALFYSTDMGISWTECATTKGYRGNIAIAADGGTFLHCPEGSSITYRSVDQGKTWTAVTGLSISNARPVADPLVPAKFYAYNSSSGALFVSTNGGTSFISSGTPGASGSAIIRTAPYREGDVWVPLYSGGLTRSTNSGQTFVKLSNVTYCAAVGFGKAASGQSYPAIYIWGTVNSIRGVHRSTDEGATWTRVNDDDHQYGGLANGQAIIGDMNVFGRFYMSASGRGIIYGESSETCVPTNIIPYISVNGETASETAYTSVVNGATVKLSPEPTSGGSWSWTGPNSFTSSDREVSIANIQSSAIYTATYTDANGCVSAAQTFALAVVAQAVLVKSISVKGTGDLATIDQKSGTLQLVATVSPVNATNQSVTWSIPNNTGIATISSTGLLTAVGDGVATVRATAKDGSGIYGEVAITITNQTVTSIEEDISARFGIYPNPVSTTLTIDNASTVKQVTFHDLRGQQIKSLSNNKSSLIISLDNVPAGVYIMELTDSKNIRYVKRVVKY